MPRRSSPRRNHQRLGVAQEAARIMREEGVRDYLAAKRKAATRLGVTDRSALPGNDEIAAAVSEQQRIFGGDAYRERLRALRKVAREAMRLLDGFEPRAVGAVLSGAITEHSEVGLHVFADAPEAVALRLMEREIPYAVTERRVRYTPDRQETCPAYSFLAGDVEVEVTVFPERGIRQPPASPVDGRPMQRARLGELEALIGE